MEDETEQPLCIQECLLPSRAINAKKDESLTFNDECFAVARQPSVKLAPVISYNTIMIYDGVSQSFKRHRIERDPSEKKRGGNKNQGLQRVSSYQFQPVTAKGKKRARRARNRDHVPRPRNCWLFCRTYMQAITNLSGISTIQCSSISSDMWKHHPAVYFQRFFKHVANLESVQFYRVNPTYRYCPKRKPKNGQGTDASQTQPVKKKSPGRPRKYPRTQSEPKPNQPTKKSGKNAPRKKSTPRKRAVKKIEPTRPPPNQDNIPSTYTTPAQSSNATSGANALNDTSCESPLFDPFDEDFTSYPLFDNFDCGALPVQQDAYCLAPDIMPPAEWVQNHFFDPSENTKINDNMAQLASSLQPEPPSSIPITQEEFEYTFVREPLPNSFDDGVDLSTLIFANITNDLNEGEWFGTLAF